MHRICESRILPPRSGNDGGAPPWPVKPYIIEAKEKNP
jgi:hypothetical protein